MLALGETDADGLAETLALGETEALTEALPLSTHLSSSVSTHLSSTV